MLIDFIFKNRLKAGLDLQTVLPSPDKDKDKAQLLP
jgi:hypothetical protein